jgi:hypothetical protein
LVRSKASLWPSAAPDCAFPVVAAAAAPIAIAAANAGNSQTFENQDLEQMDLVKRLVKALFPRSSAGNITVQSTNAIA